MTIMWFGQSCFRIETKEGSILIDPFSKEIGLRPPKIKDDLVLVTHDHHDHNNVADANPEAFIIKNPGEYEKQGIAVHGILAYHDKSEGKERGLNTIYIIKAEEMTICHLGDLGQEKLSDEQVQAIGDIDILMIPVGGTYTINSKEAVAVISQIEPKIIMPMHYKTPDLKVDIESADKFIKELGLTPEKTDKFKMVKKNLPTEEMKLIVLSN
ncbi:MAG: hypothetical protein A3J46_04225 [Candidatus Yanofskybacteria bacterium RIFCSPHIGHO2_02_FULL_41_11]|uniref:Lactamase n=1 Tax=Candidatus Yanofskybacteria bacterium RIFCSPHIGHO2_02_FULL_41_11 TaxID=1802675 RepID=A0A1F8FBX0_9BACT|nr:MAG: hypothetical protein A3J46_04225 [Candidatus Yanofskybacteria bacterium RIFCSPHIGHO2_02_FULL_41_11]